ncbi:MAG: hypothetical protein IIC67_03115 [Thaumarchaeota archaeon]|nr:hypothetical protein [Nitrososphaerota archaeon]
MGDDPQAGSIWSIWHDPTAYDHMQVGPPYLPGPKTVKTGAASDTTVAAQYGTLDLLGPDRDQMIALMVDAYEAPMAELAALLACLRAAAQLHQTNHWRTKGTAFYGDHQLFDRLYNDSLSMIDQVAERAMGQGSQRLVHPTIQAGQIFALVTFFSGGLVFIAVSYFVQANNDVIRNYIEKRSLVGMLVYLGANLTAVVVAPVSALPLIPVAANVWGWFVTGILNIIGWTAGAVIAFVLAQKYGKPIIKRLVSIEKLEKIEKKIDELKLDEEQIIEMLKRGQIRADAHISKILDRVDLTQDSFDAIMKLLLDYGKKKGLR